jgi:hypothetical protein
MLPTKFRFIWPSGFQRRRFKKIGQSETRIACGGVGIHILIFFLASLAKGNMSFCHH